MRRAPHGFDWSYVVAGSVLAAIGAGFIVPGIMLIIASPFHRWRSIMAAFSVITGLLCLGYGAEMVVGLAAIMLSEAGAVQPVSLISGR